MIVTLALRSLLAHPVRSAVLAGGFGLGVERHGRAARHRRGDPRAGAGAAARRRRRRRHRRRDRQADERAVRPLGRARRRAARQSRSRSASPIRAGQALPDRRARHHAGPGARRHPQPRARARRLRDARPCAAWTDTPADRAWAAPEGEAVLRAMDRFHAIPDVPARAASWAEWLYFNGRGERRALLPDVPGRPAPPPGRRVVGVRLQLERAGRMTSYAASTEVDERELLATAPDLTVGAEPRPARWHGVPDRARPAGPERRRPRDRRRSRCTRRPAARWRRSSSAAPAAGSPATPCR